MRFHVLKGRINFMTHSSFLISSANCWSGILPNQKLLLCDWSQPPKPTRQDAQNFNQLPFHQSVVQLFLPSRDPYWKATIWRSLHDPKTLPKTSTKKKKTSGRTEGSQDPPWDFNGVCFQLSNQPELGRADWICHFDQAPRRFQIPNEIERILFQF